MTHPRFARADVAAHPDGGVVLTTPRGTALRVHLTKAGLEDLLRACDGSQPLAQIAHTPDELELLERLLDEGCLSALDAPPRSINFEIEGDGKLAHLARGLIKPKDDGVTVRLFILDHLDHERLSRVPKDEPWSYFFYDVHRGRFGPHAWPDDGPSYDDLVARRIAAATDPAAIIARDRTRDGYLPPDSELLWMLSTFLLDVERWHAGETALGLWHEVELDPVTLQIHRHPVLPLPDTPVLTTPARLGDPLRTLVNPRTGLATRLSNVGHHPALPTGLTTVHAAGCDISRVRPWRNDPSGGGSNFGDTEGASRAALGELAERYCGNIVRPDLLTRATYRELVGNGAHAVDPDSLTLFSPAQYSAPGFPFVPLTRDSRIQWVRGHSLTKDVPAWLPASLVYINWYPDEYGCDEKPANDTCYAGVAAGPTREASVLAGLQEVIERHATMVWWLNRQPLPAVLPTPALREVMNGSPLRAWLIQLDNEFGVPVLAGVIEDVDEAIFTIGFAARSNPEEAALKAWTEGLILQEISRDLLKPENEYAAAAADGRLPDQGLKPWRADRRYLDSYRPDFHDVITLICQTQVHLDPRAVDRVRPWVEIPMGRSMDDLPRAVDLQTAVEAKGYEIFYADITTTDIAAAGLSVTRTMVPGLIGNFAAAFPLLGNRVAQDSAVRLGWRDTPLAEGDLTTIPVPHA